MKYHSGVPALHKSAVMFSPANILEEDVCLPAAVIKNTALINNISWMQRYADTRGVSLAPHGKTTMTPAIFLQQQQAGAWAIGVGSIWQAGIAMQCGINRVLMANQLVGKANMQLASDLKMQYPQTEFICCVDNIDNARTLSYFFSQQHQILDVLIEIGVNGGRCGCRDSEQVLALANEIASLPGLRLRGLELYEGVLHGEEAEVRIKELLTSAVNLACELAPYVSGEFILTGAGTVWYDVVCNVWLSANKPASCRIVIRPGCYITHDQGIYEVAHRHLLARDPVACELSGDLVSALELVALVQSVPEPGLSVVNFGKRDSAFDAGLPRVVAHYRSGKKMIDPQGRIITTGIMDQHSILKMPEGYDLQVGDLLIFSTSHPCLTFDKWKKLLLVDDSYCVIEELSTGF